MCNKDFPSSSEKFMNVDGWMPSPAPLLYLGYSPVFSLRFEANHILGPGYTDDKNAPELLQKGLSLHPARNGELWDDMLLHLLADDKGSRHFFGFYSIWKKPSDAAAFLDPPGTSQQVRSQASVFSVDSKCQSLAQVGWESLSLHL